MKSLFAAAALILFFAVGATAETTNVLSDAGVQGSALTQKILAQQPSDNVLQTGKLIIRGKEKLELDMTYSANFAATNWTSIYFSQTTDNCVQRLSVVHATDRPNNYFYGRTHFPEQSMLAQSPFSTQDAVKTAFAGSDFSFADLGLEFFHWPQQKILKHEVHRSCGCTVLESTNPDPSTNGYSRVVSWIDTETLGIVEAYAYDAKGKLLKDFYPKDFKKVNGQWQVQTLVMENVQTGSRSRLEFDLKK